MSDEQLRSLNHADVVALAKKTFSDLLEFHKVWAAIDYDRVTELHALIDELHRRLTENEEAFYASAP